MAEKIRRWRDEGLDVYAYFNNDAHGYAVENARRLADLVERESGASERRHKGCGIG
jgi:uncharacterized protein YecE (DUF72 family)